MPNILLNDDCTVRVTQFSNEKEYCLSDLLFYIPNKFNKYNVFISVIDNNGITEIIPLQFENNHNTYKVYRINYSNCIRIYSGLSNIKIMLLDKENNILLSKDSTEINLLIDNYNLSHKLAITKELETYIQNIYEKIVSLTNLNIQINNEINNELLKLKGGDV